MHRPRHRRLAAVSAAFSLATILGLVGTALALEDRSCTAFAYQEDAQTALTAALTAPAPAPDAERAAQLDRDGNGRACETLPHRDLARAAALVRAASAANTTPPASATPAVVRPSPEPVRATAADCAPTSAVPPTGLRDGSAQDDAASAVGHGEPHAGSGCPQSPTQLAAGAR
jgi:hypothetical protein